MSVDSSRFEGRSSSPGGSLGRPSFIPSFQADPGGE
jgi:hypothetical protein